MTKKVAVYFGSYIAEFLDYLLNQLGKKSIRLYANE
jgi:hypothetical protein